MLRVVLYGLGLWTVGTIPCRGEGVIVVRPDGSGDFPTIQAAIDGAVAGTTIELGDGVFRGIGNRDVDFLGKAITLRSQSSDPTQCVLDCEGSSEEPHIGVWFRSGETSDSVLEGVGIRNGYADMDGGGICCEDGSPTIRNCVVEDCEARYWGGAVLSRNGRPRFEGCTFRRNHSPQYGGAICVCGLSIWVPSASFEGCEFADNTAENAGAIYCEGGSVTADSCSFVDNAGYTSVVLAVASDVALGTCRIEDNQGSFTVGGGVGSTIMVSGCILSGNTAASHLVQIDGPAIEFEGCTISGNSTSEGGLLLLDEGSVVIKDCTVSHNGIPSGKETLWFRNCSAAVVSNSVIAFNGAGQSVLCTGGTPVFDCTNIWGNGGGDWIEPMADQLGQAGNVCADPQFCSPTPVEHANWSIQSDSPCASENSGCGLIGAWDVGCGSAPARETSWGAVKALFRGETK
ncbi:MAG: right-handed parallel beta-helix repeat-containing protein [Candidatus Eisenbacteria bacterium]